MDNYRFNNVRPTWDKIAFNDFVPKEIKNESIDKKSYMFCNLIDNRLVYRKFEVIDFDLFFKPISKEVCRYVFTQNGIIREDEDKSWTYVTSERALWDEAFTQDIFEEMDWFTKKCVLNCFVVTVPVEYECFERILRSENDRSIKLCFKTMVDSYEEKDTMKGVPKRVIKELETRSHELIDKLRIDNDLVLINEEGHFDCIKRGIKTRAYFDRDGAYFFSKTAFSKSWRRESFSEYILKTYYIKYIEINKELFNNTCLERFVPYSINKDNVCNVNYLDMLAQKAFLAAEQAAKIENSTYKLIRDEIYEGVFQKRFGEKDPNLSEVFGITGHQLKFFNNYSCFPKGFIDSMRDKDFKEHFPDVKKRIFAAYFYAEEHENDCRNSLDKDEVFEVSKTLNSLEKMLITEGYRIRYYCEKYRYYLKMRKKYLEQRTMITESHPLYSEVYSVGELPVNIKPSKIFRCHDKLMNAIYFIDDAARIEKFNKYLVMRKEIEAPSREYKGVKYSILMPADITEVLKEGRILKHCMGVDRYICGMVRKQCTILFLRDNNNISHPLLTLEERDGRITQCQGYEDSYNTDSDIRDFIMEYATEKELEIHTKIFQE